MKHGDYSLKKIIENDPKAPHKSKQHIEQDSTNLKSKNKRTYIAKQRGRNGK